MIFYAFYLHHAFSQLALDLARPPLLGVEHRFQSGRVIFYAFYLHRAFSQLALDLRKIRFPGCESLQSVIVLRSARERRAQTTGAYVGQQLVARIEVHAAQVRQHRIVGAAANRDEILRIRQCAERPFGDDRRAEPSRFVGRSAQRVNRRCGKNALAEHSHHRKERPQHVAELVKIELALMKRILHAARIRIDQLVGR